MEEATLLMTEDDAAELTETEELPTEETLEALEALLVLETIKDEAEAVETADETAEIVLLELLPLLVLLALSGAAAQEKSAHTDTPAIRSAKPLRKFIQILPNIILLGLLYDLFL